MEIKASHPENSAVGQRERHIKKMLGQSAFCCDISFETGVRQNLRAIAAAKLRGRKIVREINEWPLSITWGESRIKQSFEVNVLPKLFDGFICISDVLVEFCREHGRRNIPIIKLPMTVDCEEIDGIVNSGWQLSTDENTFSVAYAGGMTEVKDGVESLKRVAATLGVKLDLIHDISHAETLRRLANADCLVLARPDSMQARAGFPTKLGEYLALGKPVVVTPVGEIPRFLTNGRNALVGWDIANKIRWVMEHPTEARLIGIKGRETAEARFDWRRHSEMMQKWIQSI